MAPHRKLTGERFGRLVVLRRIPAGKNSKFVCLCNCGNESIVQRPHLLQGDTKSCGCLAREAQRRVGLSHRGVPTKHGHCMTGGRSRTYGAFTGMLQRTGNPNNSKYRYYGGANPPVIVCDRWNPNRGGSFKNFLADMGERPEGTTLGRFCDVGNYEPGNCAWQTYKEQGAEQRKKNLLRAAAMTLQKAA
jgi:hypothetical protein